MTHLKDIEVLAEMVWKASALAEDLMRDYPDIRKTGIDSRPLDCAERDLNKIYSDLIYYKADLLIEDE